MVDTWAGVEIGEIRSVSVMKGSRTFRACSAFYIAQAWGNNMLTESQDVRVKDVLARNHEATTDVIQRRMQSRTLPRCLESRMAAAQAGVRTRAFLVELEMLVPPRFHEQHRGMFEKDVGLLEP